eukprot:m.147920 g.147920  ORF g.147920 m.147920 type:complete len:1971 (-) comp14167_c0_seq10:5808-11720(-)
MASSSNFGRALNLSNEQIKRIKVINYHLPYADQLAAERTAYWNSLVEELTHLVVSRTITQSFAHFKMRFNHFISMYNLDFPVHQHIAMVKTLWAICFDDTTDFTTQHDITYVLNKLLKRRAIEPEDLSLDWKLPYKWLKKYFFGKFRNPVQLPYSHGQDVAHLCNLIQPYLSKDATQELLMELRPYLCPHDHSFSAAFGFLTMLLPTDPELPGAESPLFLKWLDEVFRMAQWLEASNSTTAHFLNLLCRVVTKNVGNARVDLSPYLPWLFTKFLNLMHLPVGPLAAGKLGKVESFFLPSDFSITDKIAQIMIYAMKPGKGDPVKLKLAEFLGAIASFMHPSNLGSWTHRLSSIVKNIATALFRRVQHEKQDWCPVPEEARLQQQDIDEIVEGLRDLVFITMLSKKVEARRAARVALGKIAQLSPQLVLPTTLETAYAALETLSETHRTTAAIISLSVTADQLFARPETYPRGVDHLLPLLNLTLPGIDPNDMFKTIATTSFYYNVFSHVVIVDCSQAALPQGTSEEDAALYASTVGFEDWVLQYFDQVLSCLEVSVEADARTIEGGIVGRIARTTALVCQQLAPAIAKTVCRKVFRWTTSHVLEHNHEYASRFVHAVVMSAPQHCLDLFIPVLAREIHALCKQQTQSTDGEASETTVDKRLSWYLNVLAGVVSGAKSHVASHFDAVLEMVQATLNLSQTRLVLRGCSVLAELVTSLTTHTLMEMRSVPPSVWEKIQDDPISVFNWRGRYIDLFNCAQCPEPTPGRKRYARPYTEAELEPAWQSPTQETLALAQTLVDTIMMPALQELEATLQAADVATAWTSRAVSLRNSINILTVFARSPTTLLADFQVDDSESSCEDPHANRFKRVAPLTASVPSVTDPGLRKRLIDVTVAAGNWLVKEREHDFKTNSACCNLARVLLTDRGCSKLFHNYLRRWDGEMRSDLAVAERVPRHLQCLRLLVSQAHRAVSVPYATPYTTHNRQLIQLLLTYCTSPYDTVRGAAGVFITSFKFPPARFDVLDKVLATMHSAAAVTDPKFSHPELRGAMMLLAYEPLKRLLATQFNSKLQVVQALGKVWNIEDPQVQSSLRFLLYYGFSENINEKFGCTVPRTAFDAVCELSPSALTSKGTFDAAQETERRDNAQRLVHFQNYAFNIPSIIRSAGFNWRYEAIVASELERMTAIPEMLHPRTVDYFVQGIVGSDPQLRTLCIPGLSNILTQLKTDVPKKYLVVNPQTGEHTLSDEKPVVRMPTSMSEFPEFGCRVDNECVQCQLDPTKQFPAGDMQHSLMYDKNYGGFAGWLLDVKGYQPESMHGQHSPGVSGCLTSTPSSPTRVTSTASLTSSDSSQVKGWLSDTPITLTEPEVNGMVNADEYIWHFVQTGDFLSKLIDYLAEDDTTLTGPPRAFAEGHADLFKGLFRNYGLAMFEAVKPYLDSLCAASEKRCEQRCAAEIIGGLLRGMKHWAVADQQVVWQWLIPTLDATWNKVTNDAVTYWKTAIRTGTYDHDPKRFYPLLELLLQPCLALDGSKKTLLQYSRLCFLEPVLAELSWRGQHCANHVLHYLLPFAAHPYKLVRERVANMVSVCLRTVLPLDFHAADAVPEEMKRIGSAVNDYMRILTKHVDAVGSKLVSPTTSSEGSMDMSAVAVAVNSAAARSDLDGSADDAPASTADMDTGLDGAVAAAAGAAVGDDSDVVAALKTLSSVVASTINDMHRGVMAVLLVPHLRTFLLLPECLAHAEVPGRCQYALDVVSATSFPLRVVKLIASTLFTAKMLGEATWHMKKRLLRFVQMFVFRNYFVVSQDAEVVSLLLNAVDSLLQDKQVEVRELASTTLSGFIRVSFGQTSIDAMCEKYNRMVSQKVRRVKKAKISKPGSGSQPLSEAERAVLVEKHAGVLGLQAILLAYPYDFPDWMARVLVEIAHHASDQEPISSSARKALNDFWRTHQETWHTFKSQFTEDEQYMLTDLLISPTYYA